MFVDNPTGNGTVVIVPKRLDRPDEGLHGSSGPTQTTKLCPFCPGQESLNTELYQIGDEGSTNNWKVRVITNKYPITPFHEVIIHSPDHEADFDTLPLEQVELIVQTFRQRFDYHSYHKHGRVIIFNNHGIHAGASLMHPHSQLTVVPDEVPDDMLSPQPRNNVIEKTKHYSVFCPDYSGWPYEAWITLNRNNKSFGETTDGELKELAALIQKYCQAISKKFTGVEALHKHKDDPNVPYNFYISSGANWYLRFIPRLIHPAGFELATNMGVNIIDPKRAAEEYQKLI